MAKRISSEEIERAKALYAEGLTLADVGQRIGRSAKGIWRVLRSAGVAMRQRHAFQPGHQHSAEAREKMSAAKRARHKMPAAELAEVVRLYASGMPLLSVAERVGYSPGKIRRELVEAGVTIRAPFGGKAGGGTTPHRPGTHSQVNNNTLHVPDDGGHR